MARVERSYAIARQRLSRLGFTLALLSTACGGVRAPRAAGRTPHLTVATYNVYFGAWKDPSTVGAILQTGADLVFLQEVNADWKRVIEARCSERYAHVLFEARGGSRGMAVLSRFPLEGLPVVAASAHGFHFAWVVQATTPLGRVQILNVHLRSPLSGPRTGLRNLLAAGDDHEEELRSFVGSLSPGPTLVVGDFNEGPDGRAVRWLERRGFRNALPLFHPGQPTWRGRSVGGQLEMSIDHVMFDASFEPLDAHVLRAGSSDHLPLVVTLTQR